MAVSTSARAVVRRPTAVAATVLVAALGLLGIAGCSSDDAPASKGPEAQAVEKLEDFGLSAEQAACIVDATGAETVVEATDLNAFVEGQEYQDAAKDCIADG